MTKLILLLIPLCLLLTGCGPTLQKVNRKYEPAARNQLMLLKKVLDHCRALDPLKQDSLPDKLQDVVFVDRIKRPKGNARTIWLQAHDTPKTYLEPLDSSYYAGDDWWRLTSQALSTNPPKFSSKQLKELSKHFEELNETEYVLVIKTLQYEMPKHNTNTDFYELGSMQGEAHLYRLSDGAHLGALVYRAYGQPIMSGFFDITLDSDKPEENVRTLTGRLYGNIQDFAQAILASRCPGIDSIFEIENKDGLGRPKIHRRS